MREVIITPRAKKEVLNIFEYLEFKWSERIRRILQINYIR
jgi:hypothetical protein